MPLEFLKKLIPQSYNCTHISCSKSNVTIYFDTPAGQCGMTYSYADMNKFYDKLHV